MTWIIIRYDYYHKGIRYMLINMSALSGEIL